MKSEGLRLREFRNNILLNQTELAEILGVNQDTISRYENGTYLIPLDVVKTLHLRFKLNYTWFFHGMGKPKLDEVSKATITTDLKEVLLENKILKEKIKALEKRYDKIEARLKTLEESHV